MTNLGPYTTFIVAAYAICGAVVAALIVGVMFDYRRQQRLLRDMEAKGFSRRSAQGPVRDTARDPV